MTDLDLIAATAAAASRVWAATPPNERARALVAAADALTAAQDELVTLTLEETGLTDVRLNGELMRSDPWPDRFPTPWDPSVIPDVAPDLRVASGPGRSSCDATAPRPFARKASR